jgi:cytochrome c553
MGSKLAVEDDPTKFIQAMNDYKSGKRGNAMMRNRANQFSAAKTANMAAYYGLVEISAVLLPASWRFSSMRTLS